MATVSVIIPCFNASQFIIESVESALNQTNPPLEVIIIDDGSTDDSANIAKSIDQRVRVLQQTNQGESIARNRGIEEARGEWLAFLDADDVWSPKKLEMQLAVADDRTAAVHTNNFQFGDWTGRTHYERYSPETRYTVRCLLTRPIGCPSSLIVRRCLQVRFPTWTTFGEDRIYWLALAQQGLIRLVEEPLTGWRKHSTSQTGADDMSIQTYLTIDSWLKANPRAVSTTEEQDVRTYWVGKIIESATAARMKGSYSAYFNLLRFLKTLPCQWQIRKFLYKEFFLRHYHRYRQKGS